MKRMLALILAMSILFSMAAVNVTAVEEQTLNDDIVYVEEETVEVTEPVAETEAAQQPSEETPTLPEVVEETAPVVQENTHTDHAACPCAISGATCADHTTAAAAIVWQPVSAVGDIDTSKDGNYYLTGPLVLSSQLYLKANINICLNSFSITKDSSWTANAALIRVGDGKAVTIMNCKATITNGRLAENSAGISGGNSSGTNAGAIHANTGSTLNVYGVRINDNTCTNNHTGGWTAGGILMVHDNNKAAPTLNVAYARFENNKATQSGGGAIIIRGGEANIRNTVFSGNEAKTKGGAIWMVNKTSNVSLTDCDFTGNKVTDGSASGGACLYTNIGSATFTRVTMTGNTNAGNSGTAITYEGSSRITLDDCTVTGNANTNQYSTKKAGIAGTSNNAGITISGATVIDNNMNGTKGGTVTGTECNLYLRTSGSKLTIGALESGASIRVTTGDHTVADDPAVFLNSNTNTSAIDPQKVQWIIYENRETAGNAANSIGYNTETKKFSFGTYSSHWHAACPCGISGTVCTDHTTAAAELPWQPWESTTSLPTTSGGNYYLTGNVVLSANQEFKADVNLCLNGHSITKATGANLDKALIRVADGKKLTIMNCKATITNGRLAENSAGISGGSSSGTNAGAIHLNASATLNVYGVNISGNSCTNSNDKGWTAGGIIVIYENTKAAPTLNVAYCRFEDNKATNSGGGAIIIRGGSANIRNTVFADNEAKAKGGAIWMTNAASTVYVTDCEFTGNKVTDSSASGGACLYTNIGTAVFTRVSMTGNINGGNSGTAITYEGSSNITLDDCTVTGNTNTNKYNAKKAGIAGTSNNANLTVIGATVIDDNMNGTNGGAVAGTECNLYLRTSGSKLTVGALEDGAYIRVTTGDHTGTSDPNVFLKAGTSIPVIDPATTEWIVYENRGDSGANIVGYNTTKNFYFGFQTDHYHPACVCAIDGATCADHTTAAEDLPWQPWESTNSLPTGEGNYYLTGNVVLTKQQVINSAVAICLNGFSISQGTRTEEAGKTGALIKVDKGNLVLMNCAAELSDGKLVSNEKTSRISGATSDMREGACIQVAKDRSLAVYGIEICDNTGTSADPYGWNAAAILAVADDGSVTNVEVNYCRIARNKSVSASGGAIILRGGTADIRNTVFDANEAFTKGGAIWMMNKSPVLTMENCVFTGNKVNDTGSSGGACIYMDNGRAALTNVSMTGNSNNGNHGTVISCGGNSALVLDDCVITGNTNYSTSNAKKGAIATINDKATVTVSGATKVYGNMNGAGGSSPVECDIYLRLAGNKLTVGVLEEGANLRITTGDHVVDDDPDVFMNYTAETAVIDASKNQWITYVNREKEGIAESIVGYSDDDERFYFALCPGHLHVDCACAITGATCDVHTDASEGVVRRWVDWTSTTSLPTAPGYYHLTGDVVLSSQQVINEKIYLCLNGYSITEGERTEEVGKRNGIIRIGDRGDVTILNCKAELTDGKLAENSAGIKGFTADSTSGGAIHVNASAKLNIIGVEFSNNTNINENENGWTAGAILAVSSDSELPVVQIAYSRFDSNKAPNSRGGALILRGGVANIRNTDFVNNEAAVMGAAIYMMNASPVVTITDCDFTGNKLTSKDSQGGACIYANNGTAVLTNVTMTGNENNGNHGTVITYGGTSKLTLDDCVITGNTNYSTSNAKKGAIAAVNDNASLTVTGATKVYDNMNGAGGKSPLDCNIYLRTAGSKLTVDALEKGAKIYVSTGDHTVENDPDVFLSYTANTPVIKASTNPWIVYENRVKASNAFSIIGYSDNDERFYFDSVPEHDHVNCVCAIDGISCEGHDDSTIYRWTEWTSTTSLPTTAGYYYLSGDVVLSQQYYLNANINICLNGYSITEGERTEEVGKRNAIIRVGDKGNVTILDCQAAVKDGRLDENASAIKGFTADGTSGGAIHVNAGTTLRVYGVAFLDNTNTNANYSGWTAGAILVVSDAERKSNVDIQYARFEGNKTTVSGGSAIIIRGGTANISNTVFTENESAGVVVETVTNMVDGKEVVVENKKAVGGAVWITNETPEVTITDCDFTFNKFTHSDAQGGAALYANRGNILLTNVTMTENINPGHHGTAISLGGYAELTLLDCVITNNTNTNAYSAKKGGVAVLDDNVKLTIAGSTVIDNNMNGTTGTAAMECNVFLRTSKSKLIVDQLTEGANIRVTTGDHNVDKFNVIQPVEDPDIFMVKGIDGKWDPKWDSNWVTYENNGLKVGYSDKASVLFYFEEPTDHVHCLCGEGKGAGCKHNEFGWVAWERTDCLPSATGNYYLTGDVTLIKTANFAGTSQINICLNGHNITPAKDMKSVLLNVYDDAHLSVSDCTATGSGSSYKAGKIAKSVDGGVRLGKTEKGTDAVMNLYDGMITSNYREYFGGGIRLVGKSTFNMYGGRVSSNRSKKAHGGGIGGEGGAIVNIYGGTIHGNTAYQSGGGIMVKKSVVNVYGGTISSNNAYDNGGGIYAEHCSAYISGGTFCNNEAIFEKNAKGNTVGQGGAVFVRGDANNKFGIKLRISGGNFYGNKAVKGGAVLTLTYVDFAISGGRYYQNSTSNNGGAIFPANDCKGSISGCKIYDNEAVSGAGITTYKAEVKISDCEFYDNNAKEHGAALLIQRESNVTMDDVVIRDNTAQKYGAALRMDNKAQVEMNDCLVTGNTTGESGTVFASADGTKLTLNNCSVVKNKAGISGGGLCAMSYARIIMNSGEVKENSCLEFGGGVYIRKGYMELHGGEICNNTAAVSGGGMQIEGVDVMHHFDVLLMTDGLISGNSAANGGGIRFLTGKFTVTGGTIENNTADYGGGISTGSVALTILENVEVKNNAASVNGGGLYLGRGSRNVLTACRITNNSSKEDGAGIWLNDDFTAQNLTVTGNTSDNGVGGFYLEKADYDGHSYVSNIIKIGGKILVTDNKGTAPGMYIAEGTLVNVVGSGLSEGTKIDVKLQNGLLTRTVIGAYDYEGGDLEYVITAGDRSVTDPEILPETETVVEETPDQEEQSNSLLIPVLAGAGVLLVLILILILLLLRRKKRRNAQS